MVIPGGKGVCVEYIYLDSIVSTHCVLDQVDRGGGGGGGGGGMTFIHESCVMN